MRIPLATLVAATLCAGCAGDYADARPHHDDWRRYDYNRPDPSYNGYYADRYYREGRHYRERRLSRNDRIYRGHDGRYYCRRSDGTTGLIIGGVAGALIGDAIEPGGSETLGQILGGVGGALAGRAIERNNVRCR